MSNLYEYIRSLDDNRVIGLIKAFPGHQSVFVGWVKYNEDKENKPFNLNRMFDIMDRRYELWRDGVESTKLVPVEIQVQVERFVKRCQTYYKDYDSFHVFGRGNAPVTHSRLNRIHKKRLWTHVPAIVNPSDLED